MRDPSMLQPDCSASGRHASARARGHHARLFRRQCRRRWADRPVSEAFGANVGTERSPRIPMGFPWKFPRRFREVSSACWGLAFVRVDRVVLNFDWPQSPRYLRWAKPDDLHRGTREYLRRAPGAPAQRTRHSDLHDRRPVEVLRELVQVDRRAHQHELQIGPACACARACGHACVRALDLELARAHVRGCGVRM